MNDYERYLKAWEIAPKLWEIDSLDDDFINKIDEVKDEMFDLLYEPIEKYKAISWEEVDYAWESFDDVGAIDRSGESIDLDNIFKKCLNLNALRWEAFTYNIKQ